MNDSGTAQRQRNLIDDADTVPPDFFDGGTEPWAPNGQKYHRLFEMHMGART
jgi:hypothetical protein